MLMLHLLMLPLAILALNNDQENVLRMARKLLRGTFNAGNGYPEVWIRDVNTFTFVACESNPPETVREVLTRFLSYQKTSGEVPDGYIENGYTVPEDNEPFEVCDGGGRAVCKNTCATDQESSLVQAVRTYVDYFEDYEFLTEKIDGLTVLERLDAALSWLLSGHIDEASGLIWGTTTMDWGDCQIDDYFPARHLSPYPQLPSHPKLNHHDFDCRMRDPNFSHLAITAYDNAMLIRAAKDLAHLSTNSSRGACLKWTNVADNITAALREHLWDGSKFLPHFYLDHGSPFPNSFHEDELFVMGGTAVAALAGVLTPDEVLSSYHIMKNNVAEISRDGGHQTIGCTIYPPYPKMWQLPHGMDEYTYQNGGDWTWFGGRMVSALIEHGFVDEAQEAIAPMIDRVLTNDGFWEWRVR